MPIGSMISLFGNLASGITNAYLQQQTNQQNLDLARQQNAWNLSQWFREMDYNHPVNQVQRLRMAGINPSMAYSNGIENLAPASPEMVSSQFEPSSIGNPFSTFSRDLVQEQLSRAQIENIEADTALKYANAGLSTIRTKIAGVEFNIKSKYGEELTQSQITQIKTNVELMNHQMENIDAETAVKVLEQEKLRYYIDNIQPAELAKLESETNLNTAQAKELLYLMTYKAMLMKAQTTSAEASARLANANAAFQESLNSSPGYVQDFVDNLRFDNYGKLVSAAIDAGQAGGSLYRTGLSTLDLHNQGYGRGPTSGDAVIQAIITALSLGGNIINTAAKSIATGGAKKGK